VYQLFSINKLSALWNEIMKKTKTKFNNSAYSYLYVISDCDLKNRKQIFSKSADRITPALCELFLNIKNGNLGKKPQASDLKLIQDILNSTGKKRQTVINKTLISGELTHLIRVCLNRYDKRRKDTDRGSTSAETSAPAADE
jgi:hypothetical protein